MASEQKLVTDKPVVVTGAAGFIGAHLVKQLLELGYKVRGTVRKVDKEKYKFLYDMDKNNALELVAANLIDDGSFDSVIAGCEYVMHVASPYIMNSKDPQKELVDPAVKGTVTVLESCTKAKSVKRVILTSSVAAVTDSPISGHVYTEKDWNKESSLTRLPYYYSKKLAEEAGWEYMKKHAEDKEGDGKFELVVVNPFLVIGPELTVPSKADDLNTSNKVFYDLMTGVFPALIALTWGIVDVRDVARAHIVGMENPNAEGRNLCCAETLPMKDIVVFLKKKYPDYALPSMDLTGSMGNCIAKLGSYFEKKDSGRYLREHVGKSVSVDNSKLKKVGLEYRKVEDSLYELCDWMIANKLLHPKKK